MSLDINVTVTHNLGADGAAIGELITLLRQLVADGQSVGRQIREAKEEVMSKLDDKVAEVTAAQDAAKAELGAAISRVQDDVTKFQTTIATMQSKIDELQALVDAGTATPQVIATLEALKTGADEMRASLAALDPTKPDVLPTPEPAPPAPEPVTPVEPAPAEPPPLPPTP